MTRRILLVEDNPGDAGLIREMLSDFGDKYSLRTEDRLSAGLKLLEEEAFDVVLLDLSLPDSTGFDTFLTIQDRKRDLPVIVLTGLADEEFAARTISLGAQDYLVKGNFEGNLLSSSIRYAIERKRVIDELERLRRRTELVLGSAGDGIFGLDNRGNQTFVNRAAAAMLGFGPNELIGRNGHFIYHYAKPDGTPYPIEECPVSASYLDGIEHSGEDSYWRKDGTSFPIEFTSRPLIEENRIVGAVVTFRDITERRQAEETRARLSAIVESTGAAIISLTKDPDGFIRTWNRGAERLYGYGAQEVIGRHISLLVPPGSPNEVPGILEKIMRGEYVESYETVRVRKDGARIHVALDVSPIRETDGRIIGASTIAHDITERKLAECRLNRSKQLSDALNRINATIHSTLEIDAVMQQIVVEAAQAIGADGSSIGLFRDGSFHLKYMYNMPQELMERCCSPEDMKGIFYVQAARDAVAFNDARTDDRISRRFWGSFGVKSMLVAPLMLREQVAGVLSFYYTSAEHAFTGEHVDFARKLSVSLSLALENARLFEERRRLEEEMRHMAQHDALTGLPNRRLFTEILRVEIAEARRRRGRLAVLFFDLDRFKEVNDTLGHEAGDLLLRQTAARLKVLVRESDTIARIGGDEFNIIIADIARSEDAGDVSRKILEAFRKPFIVNGHELRITASVGISICPDDTADLDTLLRYADIAMYHAKENGKNHFQFYDPSLNVKSLACIRLEDRLRRSLALGEMSVYYQPLIDISTRRIVCAEALVRWPQPGRGILSPMEFMPAAEETGFISAIDEWALKTACTQARSWLDAGLSPVCVSVNLSARRFQEPDLVDAVSSIVAETGMRPDCLDLEITESTATSDVAAAALRLAQLARLGIHISIDHFTGNSSLVHLVRLPIVRLKIDRSFIRNVAQDPYDRALINAVTAMAHTMRVKVVAEGVETEEQLDFVRTTGCDEAQGFYFSRPLTTEEFRELMTSQ